MLESSQKMLECGPLPKGLWDLFPSHKKHLVLALAGVAILLQEVAGSFPSRRHAGGKLIDVLLS